MTVCHRLFVTSHLQEISQGRLIYLAYLLRVQTLQYLRLPTNYSFVTLYYKAVKNK